MNWLVFVGLTLAAYLIGSFPSGVVLGRLFKGVDVRQYGSGKTGATNSLRTLGWKVSLLVFLIDAGKGALAVWLPRLFFIDRVGDSQPPFAPTTPADTILPWAVLACAIAAMLGHNYSIFIKFKGGRGSAAGFGELAMVSPFALLFITVINLPLIIITRYVSLGSIVGALSTIVAIFVATFVTNLDPRYLGFALGTCAMVIFHHRDNIQRLLNGTERKIGERAKPVTQEAPPAEQQVTRH